MSRISEIFICILIGLNSTNCGKFHWASLNSSSDLWGGGGGRVPKDPLMDL